LEPNSWPADRVERWPIDRLVPYARNARTHSDAQIEQVAASIREWGWTSPVLVAEDGGIIAGHCRVLAGRQLGLVEVPVMLATGWSEAQKRAYVLADNQLALNAGWNPELLRLELGELQGLEFDLALIGFDEAQLAALTANPGLTDPDEVPEPPAVPIAQRGEVWQLGRHRLMCGDATSADDVAKVLAGVQPHLMVTDPPYGVDYDATWRVRAGLNPTVANGKVTNDDRVDWRDAWALFPGHVAYVWHSGLHSAEVFDSLAARRLRMRAQIVWVKTRPVISRGAYHWQHEPCAYAVEDGTTDDVWRFIPEHEILSYAVGDGRAEWHGGRRQSTVWHIEHIKSETGHSTQKPVECMKRPIENNSSPGQAVYDPFVGSGTTIIAAEMTARACHAIEINPTYCDVSIERWQNFTGEKARRA
jgi:DNA modification methylase